MRDKKSRTYNIPCIPQITMCSHEETHGDDLQDHFSSVDYQKDHIYFGRNVFGNAGLLVNGKKETVNDNHYQNYSVKPRVDGHQLDYFVSHWVCHRQATQRHCGVVLLVLLLIVDVVILDWKGFFHLFHGLISVLSQREACDVLDFSHLLIKSLTVELFSFLRIRKVQKQNINIQNK